MIEKIDRINRAHSYVCAILKLMRAAADIVGVESIRVAADMCVSLLNEAAADMEGIENEQREKRDKR